MTIHIHTKETKMTPFEIRLELVKLARDMLNDEYHSKRGFVETDWNNQVQSAMHNQKALPDTPEFPQYFTEEDVIVKASRLNEFISNGQFLPTKL
jgi:hypothetical protein